MANGLAFSATIDAKGAQIALQRVAAGIEAYLGILTRQAAQLTKETEEANAPEGVAGAYGQGLKNNIEVEYGNGGLTARVAPSSSIAYAEAVEFGSRPHFPPAFPGSALDQWCDMHGLNTFAVAKSISVKGTRPHPYVEPTRTAMATAVPQLFAVGISRYLSRRAA